MIELSIYDLTFYSQEDENTLFSWFKKIVSIVDVKGQLNRIILYVSEHIEENDLRELIALFTRYDIDMSQLSKLLKPSNEKWFKDSNMFWYPKVFSEWSYSKYLDSGDYKFQEQRRFLRFFFQDVFHCSDLRAIAQPERLGELGATVGVDGGVNRPAILTLFGADRRATLTP